MLFEIRNSSNGRVYTSEADLKKVLEVLGEEKEKDIRKLSDGDEIECLIKNMKNFKVIVKKIPFDEDPTSYTT